MAQLIHGTTINGHIAIHAGNLADHSLATTSYVTTQINNLINGAPGALNTLDELAAALGDDASFASTLTNSLAGKLSLSGGTMTGQLYIPSAGTGVYEGAIQIREQGYVGSNQSDWSYAPAITFHWGNRTVQRFGVRADGLFAVDNEPLALRSWVTSQSYLTSLPSHNHDDRYYTESESDSRFAAISHSHTFASLTSKPTTISGYGITDAITTGNIGSQSVNYASSAGNADTVDGFHATNAANGLATIASNGYWYAPSWINVQSAGIFATTNNAHLRPNTGSYGAWEMIGSKNGWSGIWFNDSGDYLMANSNEVGHYQEGVGWKFRWYDGEMYISSGSTGGGTEQTVIHSGSIGSQSVNYASSAGSVAWGNITSVPSTFTPTSHNHDDRYYTESESDSRYIVKGSTQLPGSWPEATKFKSSGDIGTNTSGNHALQIFADDGNDAFMAFHISSDFATFFGLENSTNRLYTGGWSDGNAKYQLWDSRDFSSTNISNWNTAYGWGNHSGLYAATSHTHDDRYYTESESDSRFINESGDSMSGSLTLGAGAAYVGTHGTWTGEQNKIQWHSSHLYLQNRGGGNFFFRRSDGTNILDVDNGGNLIMTGGIYPSGQTSYYLYQANSGLWTNGNFGASSDLYLGTRSTWLSSWLNQSVQTGASPSFVNVYASGIVGNNSSQTRDKLRVWDSSQYTIGMKAGYTYGHLGNEYAMSFQMNNNSNRGFWWGHSDHTDAQGAAALTTDGRMAIAQSLSIGEGSSAVTPSSITLYVRGQLDGSDVLAVDGVNGRLFTVTDSVLDTIYSVNTIAGLPILEIMANNTVKIGKYGANSITISNSRIAINSDTVDTNFPFYVSDRSTSASRYTLANPGMGFNLADSYAQLQLYGTSGAYIDFVTGANDYSGRIIWASSKFTVSGAMWGDMYNTSGTAYITSSSLSGYATQSWVQSQGYLTSAGSYLPLNGNWTGNTGMNDQRLYLRTNGDNNHYLWNAADDWEELNAYEGTGFRVTSNTGSTVVLYVYGSSNGGYTYSPYSFRAPIFYDSDDTGYYGNFAGTSRLNELNLGTTNTRIRAVDGVGYIRLYGSASNYLGIGPYDNNGWMYFENTGNSNGVYFNSPGRYAFDSVDVTPYNDAENSLGNGSYRWAQVYTSGWLRQYGAQGMYNQDYGTHFYSHGGSGWTVTGSGGVAELVFRSNHQSTIRGYVYADTSNNIGFLNNAGNWSLLTDSARSTTLYGNLTVGQGAGASSIFMHDSDEGTREIHCNSNRIGFLNQSGSWGSWCDDSGNWVTGAGMYAAAFYDNDNTAFYVNPGGSSRIRNLYVGDSGSDWSDPGGWGTQVWFSNAPHTRFVVEARTPGIQAGIYVHTPGEVYFGSYTSHNVSLMYGGSRRMFITSGYVYSDVYMEAAGSMRAPIFYDSADTAYYLDPNSTSELYKFSGGTLDRNDGNSLHVNSPYLTRAAQNFRHRNGTMGWGTYDLNVIASNWGSGFFDTWSSPANGPGASSHYVGVQAMHYSNSDSARFHGWQMVCSQEANNRWFWRSAWDSPRSWVEMIHSGNIGSQSVNYASSAGSLSSMNISQFTNNSGYITSPGNITRLWAESHSGDYYIRNNWTGTHWHITSNHPSGVRVAYADSAGSAGSAGSADTASRATRANGNFYIDDNYGNTVVGVYSASRLQGVFAMGDAYKLSADGTSASNHYGIAWSHPNHGGTAARLTNHGMLIQGAGSTWAAISDSIWCIGDITAFSDAKVKANVEVIDNPLDRLNKVRGVTFTRTDLPNTSKRYAGVIAQEMREALPEVVTEDGNGELSVSYGNTVSLLIESIKAQQVQIEELKAEVKKLRGE